MTTSPSKRVGFIGLGTMGRPMALQVARAGATLAVYDVDPSAVAELSAAGATAAGSPREVGESSDVVICMLPHPDVLHEALCGEAGVMRAEPAPGVVVDMSTSGPLAVKECAAQLEAAGIAMVDAPVGKGPWAAETGDLTVLYGGPEETLPDVEPVLLMVGSTVVRCGPLGAGQAVKLANNLVSCANMSVLAEGYALAVQAGADPDTLLQVMSGTSADSWQLRNTMIGKITQGDLSPMFKLQLAHKDLRLVLDLADDQQTDIGCTRAAFDWYATALDEGYGECDWGAVALVADSSLAKRGEHSEFRASGADSE